MTRASASPPPSLTNPFATRAAVGDDRALSAHGFAVDHVVQRLDVGGVESQLTRTLHPVLQERAPALHLKGGHVVRALELCDEHDDAHPVGEQVHEIVIDLVDPCPQRLERRVERVARNVGLPNDELGEDLARAFGCHLLRRVAPGLVGVRVRLQHEPVEPEIHRPLRDRLQQIATAADVTGVVHHR
jgi:hypothetical protein